MEKGSELPPGDPGRKFKGRVVYQGNEVRDERSDYAIFEELSSAPSTMQASKALDAFGLLPGHAIQQTDAEQAYTQALLGGTPTWVELPKERWPPAWKKYAQTRLSPRPSSVRASGFGGVLGTACQPAHGFDRIPPNS